VKCINCQSDSKAKDRTSGVCPTCNRRFAFDPSKGDPFTDPAFAAAILRVSSSDSVRFTEAHLYYELVRIQTKRPSSVAGRIVLTIFLLMAAIFLWLVLHSVVPLFGAAGFVLLFLVVPRTKPPTSPALVWEQYQYMLKKWQAAHGSPPKLIAPKPLELTQGNPAREMPKELSNYSFDRAVICDRQETVDLLLANNFHFENNCAVLSIDGYPHAVFPSVLQMLRRNPKIEIYALHDASTVGAGLARKLISEPEWFKGIGKVTDVGFSVKHAQRMRGLWIPTRFRGATMPLGLPDDEREWLAQYSLELASMRPEQVIKRLFRAMTQPGVEVYYDGYPYYVGDSSIGSSGDAATSDGGGDSFG
jgi:hypothetical protein